MQLGDYRFNESLAGDILEKILLIAIILIVTWILARAAKWAFAKLVDNVGFFRRHNTSSGESIGTALGRIVALLIWLFGLVAILRVLDLGEVLMPLQRLLNDIAGFIPNLIGAGLIFFIGLMIARIARDLTVTALETFDFDRWVNRGGQEAVTGNPRISKTIGTIVYVLILIPVAILALEALDLRSVSEPASDMLRVILAAIPLIIGAALLIGIGYLIARFVADVLKQILSGLGVDRAFASTEVLPAGTSLSGIIAKVAQVVIVIAFAIMAAQVLEFAIITAILAEVLEIGGAVIFGAVFILFGFLIAGLLARMIGGADEEGLAASIIKWATIILFTFMGLTFMGIGEEIVQLAFGALVIGAGVAGALAFGLGGREWAGRKLEELEAKARNAPKSPGLQKGGLMKNRSAAAPGTRTRVVRPGEGDETLPPEQ